MEKTIHQVWVGDYEIPTEYQQCMEKIRKFHVKTGWNYKLWTNENLYMLNIPDSVQARLDKLGESKDFVQQADMIRIIALKQYGGVYIDADYTIEDGQRGLAGLDHRDVIITEPSKGDINICNSIFGFSSISPFGTYLYDTFVESISNSTGWWYGPSWFGETIRKYYGLEKTATNSELSTKYEEDTRDNIIKCDLRKEFTNPGASRMKHKLLYSWSPQNKEKFKKKEYSPSTAKISAVMCTFGRFKCAERAINCFVNQTYSGPKELIIFNTDVEYEYTLSKEFEKYDITVINCNTDYITKKDYTNVGAIRRDALTHATGDYYICWDDDDIFLPWFMQQGMDYIKNIGEANGEFAFKPCQSFFKTNTYLKLAINVMEASVISDINKIREYGFKLETGSEGLGWYNKMLKAGELDSNNRYCIPQYCFNWGDVADMNPGHKQSGNIGDPNNFEHHKKHTIDHATEPVKLYNSKELKSTFKEYFDFLVENKEDYNTILYAKYVTPHFGKLYDNKKKIKMKKANFKEFENKYKGHTAIIFGSGSTLLEYDPSKVSKDIIKIGSNAQHYIENIDLDFYFISDASKEFLSDVETYRKYTPNIRKFARIKHPGVGHDPLPLDIENACYYETSDNIWPKTATVENIIDRDISNDKMKDSGSISFNIIQFALYSGFEEIILIGHDCSYKNGTIISKSTNGQQYTGSLINSWEYINKHIAKYFKNVRVKIVNPVDMTEFESVDLSYVYNL